ncbi:MAG TPA: ABC transporter permease [Planctomycetota bacterium]|nr:ABC transporter permease [Planctomycetota bacterium]
MALFLASLRKDLARRLADPYALLLWIGMPLVLGTLIALVSGGGGSPRIRVLVCDLDDSGPSRLLMDLVGRTGGEDMPLDARAVELDEGRAAMAAGEASALVVLPAGFADALLGEGQARIELVTNPAQRIFPGLVEETLQAGCDLVFYAHALIGDELAALRAQVADERAPTRAEVLAFSGAIHDAIQSLDTLLFPPVLELEVGPLVEPAADEEPAAQKSIALLLFPGMLFMSLLFVAQGTSGDLWIERRLGTLRRAATAPGDLAGFLAGKLVSTSVVMLAIALFGAGAMALWFGLDARRALLGALWASAAASAIGVLMYLVQALSGSERGGGLITMLVLFPLLMLGGSFFPFEAMPEGLAAIGRRTPNGMALVELTSILDGAVEPARLARTAALLGGAALVMFAALRRRTGGRFLGGGA